jgi:hypothetical protein
MSKTIEVSDEMYDNLIQLATEMATQNPRGTKMPHIFQIRDWEKVWDDNCNGDVHCYIDTEDGELDIIHTYEDMVEYLKYRDIDEPADLQEMWDDAYHWDLDDWVDENLPELRKTSYSMSPIYKNSFLTAKAAEEHLEGNDYHYHKDADIYLNHAWRNPEAELVSEFLIGLIGKPLYT